MIKTLILVSLLINGAWLTRTSPHFIMHYQSPDRQVVIELLDLLEDEHDRLTQLFETELIRPVNVYLHPDRNSMTESAGIENASEWLVGLAINDTHIHLISPLTPPGRQTRETVKDALIHELVHICVASASVTPLPMWLNEGLAVFFSKQKYFAREVPGILRSRNTALLLDEFNDPETFERERGYAISYTIIEYLMHRFGQEALCAFVHNYPDYTFLGAMSIMQVQNEWQDFLRENYLNPRPLQRWIDYNENVFNASLSSKQVRDYTHLTFSTSTDGRVLIKVLDHWGELIQVLLQRPLSNGFHEFRIDASNFYSGIYYLEIQQGNRIQLIQFTRE